MNPYFKKLGSTVLEQWQMQNFSLAAFPQLALAAMQQSPPSENVDLEEMINEFLTNNDQPAQGHSGFGQPELIAYSDSRFYIQILFWMEGTTKIHQHGFSGAFHVMHGSSVHSEYNFLDLKSITPHLSTGNLHLKKIELLETGRTIPITSGHDCIHSLFHLESPSVTVVVRTHHDPGTDPQFNYLPPHLAIDPLQSDTLTQRRNQLLDVLENIDSNSYAIRVSEMIKTLDFERGFNTLLHTMPQLQETDEWNPVLEIFENLHGELSKGVAATLAESLRREYISQMRYHIENPEHRFFLALLMNAQSSKDILTLISIRYPHQPPTETILRWAEELIEPTDYGLTLLDATFPESIEADFDYQFELLITTLDQALTNTPANHPKIHKALSTSSLKPLFS
ncbi:MAG: hypothetical protein ACSHX6_13690 [Akkermansiaceae bacterium]